MCVRGGWCGSRRSSAGSRHGESRSGWVPAGAGRGGCVLSVWGHELIGRSVDSSSRRRSWRVDCEVQRRRVRKASQCAESSVGTEYSVATPRRSRDAPDGCGRQGDDTGAIPRRFGRAGETGSSLQTGLVVMAWVLWVLSASRGRHTTTRAFAAEPTGIVPVGVPYRSGLGRELEVRCRARWAVTCRICPTPATPKAASLLPVAE